MHTILLVIYCLLILLVSLIGGWVPMFVRLTHRRMEIAVSLVAGVMLGVGLLHLLPHAVLEAQGDPTPVFTWVLIGFLAMFFIERFFCFHHHDAPHEGVPHDDAPHEEVPRDDHAHHADHEQSDGMAGHELTWSGAAVGLSLHSIIAGIALAASMEVDSSDGSAVALAGLGTFLVILLHKPFDSMTLATLMAVSGWSMFARHVVNAIFALMIPLGVLLFHLGLQWGDHGSMTLACALAFCAGTFLCIAMSDLLPELQFHAHDRIVLSAALLTGLSVAWIIGLIEGAGGHDHSHETQPPAVEAVHEHEH